MDSIFVTFVLCSLLPATAKEKINSSGWQISAKGETSTDF